MFEFTLLVAAQLVPVPPAVQEQEIVVTAQPLKNWRGKVKGDARGTRCETQQSTGDGDLDRIACDSMRYCFEKMTPDFAAALQSPKKERNQRLQPLNRKIEQCTGEQHRLRVADLLLRRRQALDEASD